ncbi:MAG: flagellar motor protein MotB [Candidatus Zixiibacteriota bacterium]
MAKKRRKKQEESGGGDSWLMTYGDMMTLLLTFFVLLLSFSTIEDVKFDKAMGSLQGALGITSTLASMAPTDQAVQFEPKNAESSSYLEIEFEEVAEQIEELEENLNELGINDKIKLTPSDEGLLIQIDTELLFDPGKAIIHNSFKPILDKIGKLANVSNNLIIIEGHTDNNPIHTSLYPSNWELSGARSAKIIRYFIEENEVDPKRFVMKGYAEYRPIADNQTSEGRAKNRRVEILIKKSEKESL